VLTETAARWLLVLHTALGVAAVGAATHLAIWLRRYVRGRYGMRRSVRRFATLALVLHALAFGAGNLMYPTYKVEVRTAYLENEGAVIADRAARARALDQLADREHAERVVHEPAGEAVDRAARAARWFDVKEHWVALGLLASLALVFLLAFWDPSIGEAALAPVVQGLSFVVAGTLWLAAIIGVLTAAWRTIV